MPAPAYARQARQARQMSRKSLKAVSASAMSAAASAGSATSATSATDNATPPTPSDIRFSLHRRSFSTPDLLTLRRDTSTSEVSATNATATASASASASRLDPKPAPYRRTILSLSYDLSAERQDAAPLLGPSSRAKPRNGRAGYGFHVPSLRRNLRNWPGLPMGLKSRVQSFGPYVRRASARLPSLRRYYGTATDPATRQQRQAIDASASSSSETSWLLSRPKWRTGRPRFLRFRRPRRSVHSAAEGGAGGAAPSRNRRKFIKWWAVTSLGLMFYGALRMSSEDPFFPVGGSEETESDSEDSETSQLKPVRPAGPWTVFAYSTLPLKALSRLWGRVNSIVLPVWMRAPGYKLYSYVFGVNLDEVGEDDLRKYRNLGEFFYRELKPGARPIDPNAVVVSPADGKLIHYGVIHNREIEQVKGMTYSLDALLGPADSGDESDGGVSVAFPERAAPTAEIEFPVDTRQMDEREVYERHKEFARLNGIPYTLDDLIGNDSDKSRHLAAPTRFRQDGDATAGRTTSDSVAKVTTDIISTKPVSRDEKELFYAVIYLAPGDYHRFHSPANWIVRLRRHFVGELYSVAPYFQSHLSGLFTLNERVALLGQWRYGFFSMTPVGATNVGSILIHFDKDLRTNTVWEDPKVHRRRGEEPLRADSESERSYGATDSDESVESAVPVTRRRMQKNTCYEAVYKKASRLLNGYPLTKGQQMGGFNLGSTIVLVFEAPRSFKFVPKIGQKVKVGEALGVLADEDA